MNSLRSPYRKLVIICVNERPAGQDACGNRGSAEIAREAKDWVRSRGLKGIVRVTRTRCLGLCSLGPNVCIQPEDAWYTHVTLEDLFQILERHLGALVPEPAPERPVALDAPPAARADPAGSIESVESAAGASEDTRQHAKDAPEDGAKAAAPATVGRRDVKSQERM